MALVTIPTTTNPVVSVIIIGWRLDRPIIDAITSIVRSVDAPCYEVIVVLNGALPSVVSLLKEEVTGATIIDLGYNTGYGYACNRGAEVARGEYLVFLNDDAVAAPDMLTALVASADRGFEPERITAIVAAVLINTDGTIQEAGSRLLNTAGTIQLGAGLTEDVAAAAGYLSRRRIDYGSGAALLVRRDAFLEVGGHDPKYEPAYFEDVDLAFRLRSRGYDVILEPEARAIHVSGASTGSDHRFREFAGQHAGRAFVKRWRGSLLMAASAEAPLGEICAIADDERYLPVPILSTTRAPVDVALSISNDYSAWLNEALDECRESQEALRVAGAGAKDEILRLETLVDEYGSRIDELVEFLNDLEHRGIIGIAKWRIGAMMRHREEAR